MQLNTAKRASFDEGSLDQYLREISQYPLITREEEVTLAQRIKQGDEEALDKLVRSNLRFVVSVAKKYQNQGVSLSDLINEGNLGLIRAAHKFDETKGIKFISYAVWWIRQAILQALAEQSRIVRVPLNRAGTLHRIGKRSSALLQELGREPTVEEIAEGMDISEEEVAKTLSISQAHLSLDAPLTPGEDNKLLDYLPDTQNPGPDDEIFEHALTESIEQVLATLKEREAKILRLYYDPRGDRLAARHHPGAGAPDQGESPGAPAARESRPGARDLPLLAPGSGSAVAGCGSAAQRPRRWRRRLYSPAMTNLASFDVSTGADLQEVDNAVNQATKEVAQRYDFKGSKAAVTFDRAQATLTLVADDDFKMKALFDVLQAKLVKRGVPVKNLELGPVTPAANDTVRREIKLTQGIPQEKAKAIVKAIKDKKFKKAQASIQGEEIRVQSPSKDDLQEVITFLRSADWGIELKFGNYRG